MATYPDYATIEERQVYVDANERYREEIPTEADAFAAAEDLYQAQSLAEQAWLAGIKAAISENTTIDGYQWQLTSAGPHLFRSRRLAPLVNQDLSTCRTTIIGPG